MTWENTWVPAVIGAGLRTPIKEDRLLIVRAFAALPDEAFGFFAGTMLNMSFEAGGFQSDSRAAIEALGKLVQAYYELKSEKPPGHEKK